MKLSINLLTFLKYGEANNSIVGRLNSIEKTSLFKEEQNNRMTWTAYKRQWLQENKEYQIK